MECMALHTKNNNIFLTIPKDFWGAGEQLYYFYGFGEREQNNCREQRKNIFGLPGIIFREQGGTDLPWGPL